MTLFVTQNFQEASVSLVRKERYCFEFCQFYLVATPERILAGREMMSVWEGSVDGGSERLGFCPRASWGNPCPCAHSKALRRPPFPSQDSLGCFSLLDLSCFSTEEVRCSSFISIAMTNSLTTSSSGETGFISVSEI